MAIKGVRTYTAAEATSLAIGQMDLTLLQNMIQTHHRLTQERG